MEKKKKRQAAIGLLNLQIVDEEIKKRKKLNEVYRENLKNFSGIKLLKENTNLKYNYQYFPILIDAKDFDLSRDKVYNHLRKYNVYARKYFYPLCIDYKYFKPDRHYHLPNAKRIANQILCLPIFGELTQEDVEIICNLIIAKK